MLYNSIYERSYNMTQRKNKTLIIRCTEKQREVIDKITAKNNMSMAEFVLNCIEDYITDTLRDPELRKEFRK